MYTINLIISLQTGFIATRRFGQRLVLHQPVVFTAYLTRSFMFYVDVLSCVPLWTKVGEGSSELPRSWACLHRLLAKMEEFSSCAVATQQRDSVELMFRRKLSRCDTFCS